MIKLGLYQNEAEHYIVDVTRITEYVIEFTVLHNKSLCGLSPQYFHSHYNPLDE